MKTKYFQLVIIGAVLLLIASCSMAPDYNLDFPAPENNAKPIDIFPSKIGNQIAEVEAPAFGGTKVNYGDNMSIYVGRLQSQAEAIDFFKKELLSEFKNCSSNFSGNVNGQYYAKGQSNIKSMFGWVNRNYVFVLEASNKEGLNNIIENFNYISKK